MGQPGFRSWHCLTLTSSETSHMTFQSLSFLICIIGILIPVHRIVVRIKVTVSFLNYLNVPDEEAIIES